MQLPNLVTKTLIAMLSGACLLLGGCATVITGSSQKVPISSQPPGAEIRIDGNPSGVTPSTAELARKVSHRVELSLPGHRTYDIVLEPQTNGAQFGNLLAGGIIGMAVDGSSGAGNTLRPEKVEAVLEKLSPQPSSKKRR